MNVLELVSVVSGDLQADFSPERMKRTMRVVGQDFRKNARRLIARRAVSAPGAFPGRVTGEMQRATRFKLSRSGWSVRVAAYPTPAMKEFYPAFLIRGVKSHGLAPRADFIAATYDQRLEWARTAISTSLLDGADLK